MVYQVEYYPPKIHVHPEPQNVTLFGNRTLQMQLVKKELYLTRVGPKSNDRCFRKRKEREIQTWKHRNMQRRRSCEDRDRLKQCSYESKKNQEFLGATRSSEKARKFPLLEPSEGIWTCQHFDFRLLAYGTETTNFCCFKLPVL